MKTPDEIKEALRKCRDDRCVCDMCALSDGNVKKWRELMGEAYSYICKLESLNRNSAFPTDELPKMPTSSIHELTAEDVEWISVKDRPPGVDQVVFACLDNGQYQTVRTAYISSCGEWKWIDENQKVTHWMPLPEMPKEN